jgi:hypothetical protein
MNDGYISDLYLQFKQFIKEKREGKEDSMITEMMFSLTLNKNKEAGGIDMGEKHRTANGQFFRWNIDSVVVHLKAQSLVDSEFVYAGNYIPTISDDGTTDEE